MWCIFICEETDISTNVYACALQHESDPWVCHETSGVLSVSMNFYSMNVD